MKWKRERTMERERKRESKRKGREGNDRLVSAVFVNFGCVFSFVLASLQLTERNHISSKLPQKKREQQKLESKGRKKRMTVQRKTKER